MRHGPRGSTPEARAHFTVSPRGAGYFAASMSIAKPMPPPMHMLTTP
jgi:hypothetical protein